jgi:hypothetical protein
VDLILGSGTRCSGFTTRLIAAMAAISACR